MAPEDLEATGVSRAHVPNGKGLTPALRVTVSHARAHVPRKGSRKRGAGSPLFQGFRVS